MVSRSAAIALTRFTVRVGTILEANHIALHLWLQVIHLMASSEKGIVNNQLYRTLGITLEQAWFMSQRIREAMTENGRVNFGAGVGTVDVK